MIRSSPLTLFPLRKPAVNGPGSVCDDRTEKKEYRIKEINCRRNENTNEIIF
jgi:hypothetical protein